MPLNSHTNYTYITVIVNHDTNTAVWASEGHGKSVLEKFYRQLTKEQLASIKIVTGDGATITTEEPFLLSQLNMIVKFCQILLRPSDNNSKRQRSLEKSKFLYIKKAKIYLRIMNLSDIDTELKKDWPAGPAELLQATRWLFGKLVARG